MRWLLGLLLLIPLAARAQFPSPTFQNETVLGNLTIGGSATISGPLNATASGTLIGTFAGPSTINSLTAGLLNTTSGSVASTVPSPQVGDMVYFSDCLNGSQVGNGTGCPAFYNDSGVWTPMPTPTTLSFTIGGQAISLGGATSNRGTGPLIQTASATAFVSGDCVQFDNTGATVDALVPCGAGGGGSGTVTASQQFSMVAYSGAGSSNVVSGLGIVNNAVLATNGSGVPAETTTLPSGLTIPSATLSNPTMTGTIIIGPATFTGKQTFVASSVSTASFNVPPGVAPTSPINGDHWTTSVGTFDRVAGVSQGPFLYNVATTGPLGGGGLGPTLTLTCTTCATTTNGGALSATGPVTISAAGLIALGVQPQPITWVADAAFIVHNDTYNLVPSWPYHGGTVNTVEYWTGGTTSPSYTATLEICTLPAGTPGAVCTPITSCSSLSVSSATPTTTTCTAANAPSFQQALALVITGVTGSPSSSTIQVTASKPAS